jgi:hypothetical protein
LQFVVLTLIAEQPVLGSAEAGAAFATPTIVHFGTALLLASLIRVPWHAIAPAAVLWGLVGAAGALYVLVVARRMRAQKAYLPEMEDWLFHVALPFAAYAALALSAPAAASHLRAALFVVGGAALVLLFIGIHNAWDAVSYHVFVNMRKAKD